MSGYATQSYVTSQGYLTSITSGQVTTALGYTPYNGSTNPNGYLSSITSSQVTTALGYTPYNAGSSTVITSTNYSSYLSYAPVSGSSYYAPAGGSSGTNWNCNNLYAAGDVYASYSDVRLKTNIRPITGALDKVNSISGVYYNPSDVAIGYGFDSSEQVGVIAQEIKKVLPQIVKQAPFDTANDGSSKSGEKYITVQYEKIVPLLIEAIKELSAEVESLKNQIRG